MTNSGQNPIDNSVDDSQTENYTTVNIYLTTSDKDKKERRIKNKQSRNR